MSPKKGTNHDFHVAVPIWQRSVCLCRLVLDVAFGRNFAFLSSRYLCSLLFIVCPVQWFLFHRYMCKNTSLPTSMVFLFLSAVQSHKVCREPAGDDQLSHGMQSLACEFLFFFFCLTAVWWQKLSLGLFFNCQCFIYCWEGRKETDERENR